MLNCKGGAQLNKKYLNTVKSFIYSLVRWAFLIGIIYVILFPIIYALSSSLMTDAQLTDPSVNWIPKVVTFENYKTVWKTMNYPSTFAFTVMLVVLSTLFQIFSCSLAAYGLARFKFKGKNIFFILVVVTIIVPPQMLIVQQYSIFKNLGLLDTVFTYFLPASLGQGVRSGLMIYIFRQFVKNLPKELEEAAYIDGCSTFNTFWRIVVPSSAVSFLVVGILSIVWYWNETLIPSMFFDNSSTLSIELVNLKTALSSTAVSISTIRNLLMSGVLLFLTPIVIMYAMLQKYFIQGIEHSGLVG